MPFQFFRPVIKKIDAALQTMTKASNPVVGVHIHKVKFPKVLWRIDGRCAQETSKVGFEALCSKEEVESITLDRLNNYQSFNLQRFGIGACESLKDLNKGYVEGNPGLASKRSIYGFYSKAFHLSQLRLVANTEGNERDYENEFIVVDAVNPKNFIFSTGPKYRDKLLNGLLVPNEMALFNSSLPKTLRLEDIQSVQTLLPWLVKNNAEEAAIRMTKTVYGHLSQEALKMHFKDNNYVGALIQDLLSASSNYIEQLETEFSEEVPASSGLSK